MAVHRDEPGLQEKRPYVVLPLGSVSLEKKLDVIYGKVVFVRNEKTGFAELNDDFRWKPLEGISFLLIYIKELPNIPFEYIIDFINALLAQFKVGFILVLVIHIESGLID